MAIVLPEQKLVYVSVPKCACSSLKRLFYHIKTGQDPAHMSPRPRLHRNYPSEPFSDLDQNALAGFVKVAALRDPVERFVSGYRDKILRKKCMYEHRRTLRERVQRLNRDPSLEEFVDRIEQYRKASEVIRRHFAPLVFYLGDDPEWYSGLFSFSRLDDMRDYVSEVTNCDVALPHINQSLKKYEIDKPGPALSAKIQALYQHDYDVYGKYL